MDHGISPRIQARPISFASRLGLPDPRVFAFALPISLGALILLVLVLAVLPWNSFPVQEADRWGGSIQRYFNEWGFGLKLFTVGALLCVATYVMQRKQDDRFAPLALLSMSVGLLGGVMTVSAMSGIAARGIEDYPKGLVELAVATLATCALTALAALGRLLFVNKRQRGRMIAVYLLVWSSFFAYAQWAWVLESRGSLH